MYSPEALQALMARIEEEWGELNQLGVHPESACVLRDVVEFRYFAADRVEAERLLSSRYGSAVRTKWRGASRFVEQPHPFDSWVCEDNDLIVFYRLRPDDEPGRCTATEFEDKVVVRLTIRSLQGLRSAVGGHARAQSSVRLDHPVGDRAVIDAVHNAVRPFGRR
jgi:hypothetical protein